MELCCAYCTAMPSQLASTPAPASTLTTAERLKKKPAGGVENGCWKPYTGEKPEKMPWHVSVPVAKVFLEIWRAVPSFGDLFLRYLK